MLAITLGDTSSSTDNSPAICKYARAVLCFYVTEKLGVTGIFDTRYPLVDWAVFSREWMVWVVHGARKTGRVYL